MKTIIEFAKDDRGQDTVEYALLLAFLCVAGAAAFISMGGLTTALWSAVNSRMAAANEPS